MLSLRLLANISPVQGQNVFISEQERVIYIFFVRMTDNVRLFQLASFRSVQFRFAKITVPRKYRTFAKLPLYSAFLLEIISTVVRETHSTHNKIPSESLDFWHKPRGISLGSWLYVPHKYLMFAQCGTFLQSCQQPRL